MGGERFDTNQQDVYLFGENDDLNFLGSKPIPVSAVFICSGNLLCYCMLGRYYIHNVVHLTQNKVRMCCILHKVLNVSIIYATLSTNSKHNSNLNLNHFKPNPIPFPNLVFPDHVTKLIITITYPYNIGHYIGAIFTNLILFQLGMLSEVRF